MEIPQEIDVEIIQEIEESNSVSAPIKIWTGKKDAKQLHTDKEANSIFLGLVKSYWKCLCDSKKKKKDVWGCISVDMEAKNYDLGDAAVAKCEQKWMNLYKKYKQWVKECEQTGSVSLYLDRKPPYYDEISEIIGETNSGHPVFVGDSILQSQDPDSFMKKTAKQNKKLISGSTEESEIQHDFVRNEEMGNDEESDNSLRKNNKTAKRKYNGSKVEMIIDLIRENEYLTREREDKRLKLEERLIEERCVREKQRQEQKQKRHEERMQVSREILKALLGNKKKQKKKKKRQRDSSDSDSSTD